MTTPIWIIVTSKANEFFERGDCFEGHQLHWADCFFSNATRAEIVHALDNDNGLFDEDIIYEIRDMTAEEVAKYPEAVDFEQCLIKEYGES